MKRFMLLIALLTLLAGCSSAGYYRPMYSYGQRPQFDYMGGGVYVGSIPCDRTPPGGMTPPPVGWCYDSGVGVVPHSELVRRAEEKERLRRAQNYYRDPYSSRPYRQMYSYSTWPPYQDRSRYEAERPQSDPTRNKWRRIGEKEKKPEVVSGISPANYMDKVPTPCRSKNYGVAGQCLLDLVQPLVELQAECVAEKEPSMRDPECEKKPGEKAGLYKKLGKELVDIQAEYDKRAE